MNKSRSKDSYKHISTEGRYFYRRPGDDDSITLDLPDENYTLNKQEIGNNQVWFDNRWIIINKYNPNQYCKHILYDKYFYRRKGMDSTVSFNPPPNNEQYLIKYENDNKNWFNDRLSILTR